MELRATGKFFKQVLINYITIVILSEANIKATRWDLSASNFTLNMNTLHNTLTLENVSKHSVITGQKSGVSS
jgi:hypothetical protein